MKTFTFTTNSEFNPSGSPYYQARGARQFNATFGGRVNGATNLTTNSLYDKQFT